MSRVARFLWRLWAVLSLLWVAAVVLVPLQPAPTAAQIWLTATGRMPPMRAYLQDMEDLCRLLTAADVAALPNPPNTIQDYDGFQIPHEQRNASFDAWWTDTLRITEILQDRPDPTLQLHCEAQDYIGAALARSADTRLLREARAAIGAFLRTAFIPPLNLAAFGLFLLWSPFKRRSRYEDPRRGLNTLQSGGGPTDAAACLRVPMAPRRYF